MHDQAPPAPVSRLKAVGYSKRSTLARAGKLRSLQQTSNTPQRLTQVLDTERCALLLRDQENLLRSNQELEHFAEYAAHDLKSPLNAALGWLRSLHAHSLPKHDKNLEQTLQIIERNIKRSINQVNDILNFARLNRPAVQRETCDMNAILDHVLEVHRAEMRSANVLIERTSMPKVLGNGDQLTSVLSNLVENAIKYRSPSRCLRLQIGCRDGGNFYEFFVKDNGIGIPESKLQDVFTPFTTIPSPTPVESTGIGLAHCRRVIELHHGQIWAETNPSGGSTFRFTIPK